VTKEEIKDLCEQEQPPATPANQEYPPATPANQRQVAGNHYRHTAKDGEQHWDRMWRLYREAWFVGNITKYVERYRHKDGIKDLEKARHYLDKLIELETAALVTTSASGQSLVPDELEDEL
jgi:hypothetical protein